VSVAVSVFISAEHEAAAEAADAVRQTSVVHTPFGDVIVCEILVPGSSAPHELDIGSATYVRLLDRFYLPAKHDAATTDAFFTLIADAYDTLVDAERNIENVVNLLRQTIARSDPPDRPLRILDFGCGTGFSTIAIGRLRGIAATNIYIVGFDRCARMRAIARRRGLRVLPAASCANLSTAEAFDAVVASYVFHFGVDEVCFNALHDVLLRNGVLVGNYHKPTSDALSQLDAIAIAAGFRLEARFLDAEHESISVFRT